MAQVDADQRFDDRFAALVDPLEADLAPRIEAARRAQPDAAFWQDRASARLAQAAMRLPGFSSSLASAAMALALAGCISKATEVDRHATVEQAAGKAIVVISVSHDRSAGSGGSARFVLDGGTPEAVQVKSAAGPMELPMKNHFHDRYGHVYVLEVAPGHHRFTTWTAFYRGKVSRVVSGLVPLEFDVNKGDVIYLGDLHVRWLMGKMLFINKETPYAATAEVQDLSADDLPLAERLNPAIAGKVRIATLPLGPWGKAPPGETNQPGDVAPAAP